MGNSLKNLALNEAQIIANNVRELMNAREISENHLACILNVSVMTIRRILSGETADPRISTLSLLADYFRISVDSLLKKNHMPINLMKEKNPHFVPIIDWKLLSDSLSTKKNIDFSKWPNWYPLINTSSLSLDKNAFALESKSSMQPRYPKGTLLIIDPNEEPVDNDIILLKSSYSNEASLRELVIDSPKWILQPIIAGSELLFYNENEHDIIGVVVLTVLQRK